MELRRLPSGRIVFETYRDPQGYPKYYQYFDTRSGALRLAFGPYWDGRDKSQSLGVAATLQDFVEILEWVMEYQQMSWWTDPRNDKLIWFRLAFAWLPPITGDKLIGSSGKLYNVIHVPRASHGTPWNLSVLLDAAPEPEETLRWVGDARDRNLVDFRAEYGSPDTPTPGNTTEGDVGTKYDRRLRPTITYLLVRQEPYTLHGAPFGSSKELKSRPREEFTDPNRPQRVIRIFGQRKDNLFRFSCLHPRAETADALAHWFQTCIDRQTPSIKANGVNEILFWSARVAERRGRAGDDLAVHEVNYYVVTEELTVQETSSLRRLNVRFRVALGEISDLALTGYPTYEQGWLYPFTGVTDESGNWLWGNIDIQDYRQTGSP